MQNIAAGRWDTLQEQQRLDSDGNTEGDMNTDNTDNTEGVVSEVMGENIVTWIAVGRKAAKRKAAGMSSERQRGEAERMARPGRRRKRQMTDVCARGMREGV